MIDQETQEKKLILEEKIIIKRDLAKALGSPLMIMEIKSNSII